MSAPTTPVTTPTARVLVVDDNDEGRRALERYLTLQGFTVIACPDGTTALAALRDGPPPDVLLVDLNLPDVDGLEVGRQAHELDPNTRVALMTGGSIEADLRLLSQQRLDHLFYKPLDLTSLVSWIRDLSPAHPPPT